MTERRVPGKPAVFGLLVITAVALAAPACSTDRSPGVPPVTAQGAAGSTSATSQPTASQPVSSSSMPATVSTTTAPDPTATPGSTAVPEPTTTSPAPSAPIMITVLYDNHAALDGVRADHGFSCLIRGLEKTVLFDTGGNGDILLSNMEALEIATQDVEVVVLSHVHSDHTGGLERILADNAAVTVYYPASFSERFARSVQTAGASPVAVEGAISPCPGLFMTAPFGNPAESGLVVATGLGQVLITGCAHPGIVEMVKAASELVGERVYAVMGGFHLMSHSPGQVDRIIQELKDLGVARCGPAHCTGEAATARMKAAFGAGTIEMGVGSTVTF